MASKTNIIEFIQATADGLGGEIQKALGTPGSTIIIGGESVATGQAWTATEGSLDTIIDGIGEEIDDIAPGGKHAHGEISQQVNTNQTTISLTTSFYLVNMSNTGLSGLELDFDSPEEGRLRYTGTQTKTFRVEAVLTVIPVGATLPAHLLFRIAKNGSPTASDATRSEQGVSVRTASIGENCKVQGLFSLAQNDYLELYVRNYTAAQNVIVSHLNLRAVG